MKPNNKDCKIVQDLLPNYIEELTDEVTNEYIEEHIVKCPECANVLKAMNGDIKLEAIQQDKEINYLKNVRKRVKRTIAIVSFVTIIVAACIVGYIHKRSQVEVNNYTFLRASYVVENEEETIDGKLYGSIIAVFNEKDICISVRAVEEGYTEDQIDIQKNIANDNVESLPNNLRVIDGKIHYNLNVFNGLNKDEIKKIWIERYQVKEIEEI